jgi:signal transduction histidine kinase
VSPIGQAAHVLVVFSDVSSIRKLEHHLQRLDRLASIGTLSASMAHEIKNALVPVKTFVGLILEKNPEAELAGTVRRELERVETLVSRMLKFAAPAKPALAPVRLHELLEHSLHLAQHRAEGKLISFHRQFNAPSDSCHGDDYQLEQAVLNLLLNAVEAMGPEGALTVRTDLVARDAQMQPQEGDQAQRFLRLDITDTGVGIPPEKLDSVFEPFFTTKPHGTGLGLAVTRRIIEEHNGLIRVKSQPGKGTTFTVFLPAPD